MPILGLVARAPSSRYEAGWVAQRLRDSRLAAELRGTRLGTDFALFGGLLGTGESLQRFAGAGPLNTDDRPVVSFQAPGFVYRAQPPASVRLLALVDALDADPDLVLDARDAPTREFRSRLLHYWEARDAFLHAGSGIAPTADVRALLARTREPLLRIVRMSPDFDAAYDPLLAMARALYDTDPQSAVDLLRELESANGSRVDARDLRLQLQGG
jgi:spermidine synthase